MHFPRKAAFACLFSAAICIFAPAFAQAQALPSVRRVQVLGSSGQVEIEIETSEHIVPQINLLTGPDRLVVDFVNARPSPQLRNLSVNRAEVKNLRVGLFSSDPPVTRLVLDLNGPQPYQVFPSGRTVIVKIGNASEKSAALGPASGPVLVNTNYPAQASQIPAPTPAVKRRLEVSFQRGLLSITSNKASMSEVLYEIHQRTGAEIDIPSGAEQEQVVANIGPAPAPEVLAHLLNGSRFNFMILSSSTNPQALDRVILSPRSEGAMPAPQLQPLSNEEVDTPPDGEPPPRSVPPGPTQNGPTPPPDPDTRPEALN
jgi:AMIN domain